MGLNEKDCTEVTPRDKYHCAHRSKDKRADYFHTNERPDSSKDDFLGMNEYSVIEHF